MEEDLLPEFLVECSEIMTKLDGDLVTLEKSGQNPALMNEIFRGIHTIKGSSGFFELKRLESVAHAAENILDKMRQGTLKATNDSTNLIFQAVDVIKKILDELETQKKEPAGDDSVLIGKIKAVLEGKPIAPPVSPPPVQEIHVEPKPVVVEIPKVEEKPVIVEPPVIAAKSVAEEKPTVEEKPVVQVKVPVEDNPLPQAPVPEIKKPVVVISMIDSSSEKINREIAEGLGQKVSESVPVPEIKKEDSVQPNLKQEPVVPVQEVSIVQLQQEAAAKRERERLEQEKANVAPVSTSTPVLAVVAPTPLAPIEEKSAYEKSVVQEIRWTHLSRPIF